MNIAHSRIYGYLSSPRLSRRRAIIMQAWLLALLQGCAMNAPSCDGRFEPINRPAPVSTAGEVAQKDGASTPDSDHE